MNTFKHLVATALIALTSIGMSAKDVTFSASEILAGTTKDGVKVETAYTSLSEKQVCKLSGKAYKVNLIEIKNSAGKNYDTYYLHISSTADITGLTFEGTSNSSATADMPLITWDKTAFNLSTFDACQLVTLDSYVGDCSSYSTAVSVPAGTKAARMYRQVTINESARTFDSKGSKYGEGKTGYVVSVTVSIKDSDPEPTTPTISNFTISGVTASIDQTAHTIKATLPYGTSLTSLTPTVTTADATGYTPTGAQNFSSPVTYNVTDGTKTTSYTVTISVAAATASTDATLKDLKVGGTTVSGFTSTTTAYSYTVSYDATGIPSVTATANDSKATVSITQAPSVTGRATVLVTAEDGKTTQTYTVQFSQQAKPDDPVPSTSLTLHQPEVYEAAGGLGGYNTPLVQYNGREYETYYINRDASSNVNIVTQNGTSVTDASKATTTDFVATDGWMSGTSSANTSSTSETAEEFTFSGREYKITDAAVIEMHIAGYDQFRMLVRDNATNKDKWVMVDIDGKPQTITPSTSKHVVSFDISTGEHLIKIYTTGSSTSRFYAWSLRLSNQPSVRYLSGDDKSQVVNQTKPLEPITYRMKNGSQGTWKLTVLDAASQDVTAASGLAVNPVVSSGDTARVEGNVMLPVGTYTYRIASMQGSTETSALTGTFTVKTEIFAPDGTTPASITLTTPINDAASGLTFDYDAVDDADVVTTWTTQPAGLQFTQDNDANRVEISGTPTAAGSYGFTVSVKGGNTIQGTLNVIYPAPLLTAPDNVITKVKDHNVLGSIVYTVKYASGVTAAGLPNGIIGTFNAAAGTFTISGTANVNASTYPQVFDFSLTAKGQAGYTGPDVTANGQITVLDPTAKAVLYLFNGEDGTNSVSNTNAADDRYVVDYLGSYYDVTPRQVVNKAQDAASYMSYDAIIISESVDATDAEVLNVLNNVDKPIVNMKVFTYNPSRLNWGSGDNGSQTTAEIHITQPSHPVFKGLSGTTVSVMSDVDLRGLQCATVTLQGSYCLATAQKRGEDEQGVAVHEVPGNVRHAGFKSRYMLIPYAARSYAYISNAGKALLRNAVDYVIGQEASNVSLPTLEITTFSVNGKNAAIYTSRDSIFLHVSHTLDITALAPVITLADQQHTIVTPGSGETVDFSQSFAFPIEYVVSDYINKRTYKVVINNSSTGLNEVALEGIWFDGRVLHNDRQVFIYLYDMQGRRVAFTNADLDMESLPRGVYLVQTATSSMKIVR